MGVSSRVIESSQRFESMNPKLQKDLALREPVLYEPKARCNHAADVSPYKQFEAARISRFSDFHT